MISCFMIEFFLNKKIFLIIFFLLIFLARPVSATSTSTIAMPSSTVVLDSDKDGLPDSVELLLGTDPNNLDTDGDGYKDGQEAYTGFNPLKGKGDASLPRSVKVNLSNQTMDYFLNGVDLGTMLVSTGRLNAPSPTGTFSILRKVPVKFYRGLTRNFPNTKWNLEYKPAYYIHGAYWHNDFGKRPVSGGCVNLKYSDAKMMYRFLRLGDKVVIVGKTPRGTLALK